MRLLHALFSLLKTLIPLLHILFCLLKALLKVRGSSLD